MAAAGWRIDFTAWPRSIDIGTASGAVDWVAPSTAPGDLAALVTVDLDRQGRCVGFEVWDRAALESAPTATTGLEPVMPPEPLDGGTHRTLDKWLRSLRVIAGSGDPHASVHWSRRRAYDVSAGLDRRRRMGRARGGSRRPARRLPLPGSHPDRPGPWVSGARPLVSRQTLSPH
jgi:hypothetical protein